MKARVLTSAERQREKRIQQMFRDEVIKEATELGNRYYEEKMDDALKRSQYIDYICMLRVGLSAKTINRCIKEKPAVCEEFAKYKTEEIADYVFCRVLKDHGVQVEMTKEEM